MARPKKDLKGIKQQADGRYRVDLVRVLPNGQPFRKATNCKTLEDAVAYKAAALKEYEGLVNGATVVTAGNMTLREWCDYCLETVMPNQANRRGKPYEARTLNDYRLVLGNHVYPSLGEVKLTSIGVEHVDALIAACPSPAVKKNVKVYLSRLLTLAEERGKRPTLSNPCRAVRLPVIKNQRTSGVVIKSKAVDPNDKRKRIIVETPVPDGLIKEQVRVLSFDEEARLLEAAAAAEERQLLTLVMLGLRLGLRIGEALALDWSAVDFDANTVTIDQSLEQSKGVGKRVKDTKSVAGNRVLPMSKSLAAHLKQVKANSKCPFVVHNTVCKRADVAKVSKHLRELMVTSGLQPRVEGRRFLPQPSFHDLRRTCLSRLASGRVAPGVVVAPTPPNTLIRFSGHEDVETLLSYYVAADDSMVRDAVANLP